MQRPGLSISAPAATSPYAAPVRPAAPSQYRREAIASPQPDPGEQIAISPLAPAIELARAAGERLETVRDYQCILIKREHTGGKLREAESFALKVRQQPLSMYVQCLGPALPRGREILFVDGQNSCKALVHTVGMRARFVGTENLDLQSPRLLNESRHALPDYAMHAFVAALQSDYKYEASFGEADVKIDQQVPVEDRMCVAVQVTHPVPRRQFRFHQTRVYFDRQTQLPIRFEAYTWPQKPGQPPVLLEERVYRKLALNTNLSDADFDVKNPAYKFK
jgi:hypothetical protein